MSIVNRGAPKSNSELIRAVARLMSGSGASAQGGGNADKVAIRRFFERLHGTEGQGFLIIWTRQDKATKAFDLGQAGAMDLTVDYCADRAAHQDVYAAVGLQHHAPEGASRGKEDGVIICPGVWVDIDILGPAHAATNLPKAEEEALGLVSAVRLEPSVLVRSGFGIQPYWLLREPLVLKSEQDRAAAKALTTGFQARLRQLAASRGWGLDSTGVLCRVLRIPGTFNRKIAGDERLVTAEYSEKRYNSDDFADLIEEEPGPAEGDMLQGAKSPPAELPPILDGCAWMRHCRDDAATLPEPEWYRMLSIAGRCKDGTRLAHDLSRPHPKYTTAETEQKLRQALEAAGPSTCAFIENDLGQGKYCSRCKHYGKITSPIVLGIPKRPRQRAESQSGAKSGAADGSRLPTIHTTDRQLRDISREALGALRIFNNPPSLFVRSGKAVCVTQEESGRHFITDVSDRILRNRLTRSANFYRGPVNLRNCAPPMDVAKDILAMPPVEWAFPPLEGIIEAPALREDGSLIILPGYDAAGRLYYSPDPTLILPDVPDQPTPDDGAAAVELIRDILGDFPFVDEASRANAIASMLTPICRPAIKGPTPHKR